jgi:hypothetical protein
LEKPSQLFSLEESENEEFNWRESRPSSLYLPANLTPIQVSEPEDKNSEKEMEDTSPSLDSSSQNNPMEIIVL